MITMCGVGALVTGGTSGLGAATATALVRAGASAVVVGRPSGRGSSAASALGAGVRFAAADVADEEAMRAAVSLAADAPRGIRVAIGAAGVAVAKKTFGRDGVHPLPPFRQMLETNLVGSFNLLRLAAEAMATNEPEEHGERGVVIVTSSIGAVEGQMGQVAYAAAKSGVLGMVLPAARDLAHKGIRVMAIMPGVFDTPFIHQLSEQAQAAVAGAVPFPPRLGHAEEYASLVLEIIRNPMLNGSAVRLDGALRLGPR